MSRKTVLIVEDSAELRVLFSDALALAGFVVRQAADGMEALRLLDSAPPDVVVLDLGLPHVTGYDVLFELKQHGHTRDIPVVIVTGSKEPVEGVTPGCLLKKPVQAEELVRTVHTCLHTAGARTVADPELREFGADDQT